jgi:GNAT superfamily N-acetyltransferase
MASTPARCRVGRCAGAATEVRAIVPAVPEPRLDLSDVGLIEAIEADQVAARILDPEIPVVAHLDPDVSWAVAPTADTFRNVVLGARFAADDADGRIRELTASFLEHRTAFVWWVAPSDLPLDLGTRLERGGLTLEGRAPAMAADLAELPLHEAPPQGLDIVPVTDVATLGDYLDVVAADWLEATDGEPTEVQRRTFDAFAREIPKRFGREPVPLRWIGRIDGEVVATSRVAIGAGVAGLYAVLTRPSARGRGVGRAMTLAALRSAASLGYRIGVLQSSDLGYSVYRRLGFRELFTYEVYVHPGPVEMPR